LILLAGCCLPARGKNGRVRPRGSSERATCLLFAIWTLGRSQPAHRRRRDGRVQFSRDRPCTRSNSATLFVTSVSPIARA